MTQPACIITRLVVLSSLVLLFSSCGIHLTKRRYKPGYYVDVRGQHKTSPSIPVSGENKTVVRNPMEGTLIQSQENQVIKNHQDLIPGDAEKKTSSSLRPYHVMVHPLSDDCDVLYLKKGPPVRCIYIQMTDRLFTYKTCGTKESRVESVDLSKVNYVVLQSGDTLFPDQEIKRWTEQHGVTGDKEGDRKSLQKTKTAAAIIYGVLGTTLTVGGGVLLVFGIVGGGSWVVMIILYLITIFLGGILLLGGVILIIMAIITALRK